MEETRFSALLNWTITNICNFHCVYCGAQPYHNDELMKDIDVEAVTRNLDMQGEIFCVNFSGGEPFMVSNIIKLMETITKNHYISLNSNLVSKKAEEMAKTIDPGKIIFINASFHIFELEKYNLLDKYIFNFLMFRSLGINIFSTLVTYPGYLPVLNKYRVILEENGIMLIGQPFIGEYNDKKYPESHTPAELKEFRIKDEDINKREKYFRKNKPCSAGFNFGSVLNDGNILTCYGVQSGIGNIFTGFKFNDFILKCPSVKCTCPTVEFNPHLLKNALGKAPKICDNFEVSNHSGIGEPLFRILKEEKTYEATKG